MTPGKYDGGLRGGTPTTVEQREAVGVRPRSGGIISGGIGSDTVALARAKWLAPAGLCRH